MTKIRDRLIHLLGGVTCKEYLELDKRLDAAIAERAATIKELINLQDGTPDDCKRGAWCEECAFAKRRGVRVGSGLLTQHLTVHYCGKAEACKHLLPKTEAHHG